MYSDVTSEYVLYIFKHNAVLSLSLSLSLCALCPLI